MIYALIVVFAIAAFAATRTYATRTGHLVSVRNPVAIGALVIIVLLLIGAFLRH